MDKEHLIKMYDGQAGVYDNLRRRKKFFDHGWRQRLLSAAKGEILEVSVGAGANFKFYAADAAVTAVDLSPAMIEYAKAAARDSGIKAEFITAKVEELDFGPGRFDTVVSTLSLCAYDDPVYVLNGFSRWCKKDGIILLLEHGISRYGWIHWLQNRFDALQYRKIGCHANRDILGIVRQSGLQINRYERKLLGALYLIWAKPM